MRINQFRTKTKLTNYVRHFILNEGGLGVIKNQEHIQLLNDLIDNHYNKDYLIGCGIKEFFTTKCDINPKNRKFNIRRIDLSEVDFSYKKAILGKEPSEVQYLKRAFRFIVRNQTEEFKNKFFEENADYNGYVICEVTGLKFKKSEAHIDHIPPTTFDYLFSWFLDLYNLKSRQIEFDKSGVDNRPIIKNQKINKLFYDFHQENAKVRCIFWKANLQQKKYSYI